MQNQRVFEETRLPDDVTVVAPDGSDVRVLLRLPRGSMAHFSLAPGFMSRATRHRTVEEIWYVLGGHGEMWRGDGIGDRIVSLDAGVCLTIPVGTSFQFRSFGPDALTVVAVTMPPWPGEHEAEKVTGCPDW